MYYIIADIHGHIDKLTDLIKNLSGHITKEDTFIFLGDYIDRGGHSFEVIDFLIALSKKFNTIFLMGNHEDMFIKYYKGNDKNGIYLINGGATTLDSYKKNCGKFELPETHINFFDNLLMYYETEDFIAVHAGLHPDIDKIEMQSEYELIWIREEFFRSDKKWEKTIIFGHTPTVLFSRENLIYEDNAKNIIGIDSGVIYGRPLTCLRWPDKKIFTG